jgi:hypothetical protein
MSLRATRLIEGSTIEQREVDDVYPTENAMNNRPQYRMVGVVGDRHR